VAHQIERPLSSASNAPLRSASPAGIAEPPRSETGNNALGTSCESDERSEGERKTVTALFADIKGSTELMRDLDPEEARALVDPVLQLMMAAVHRYGGYVAVAEEAFSGIDNSRDESSFDLDVTHRAMAVTL
jgi:class 3 adenylate cyclase